LLEKTTTHVSNFKILIFILTSIVYRFNITHRLVQTVEFWSWFHIESVVELLMKIFDKFITAYLVEILISQESQATALL